MTNSNLYEEKLKQLLDLQHSILKSIKKGEIIPKKYFEDRNKLMAQILVLKETSERSSDSLLIKEEIIRIEKKILKEAEQAKRLAELNILQHGKSTANMVNYFKSQIASQSEVDFKA